MAFARGVVFASMVLYHWPKRNNIRRCRARTFCADPVQEAHPTLRCKVWARKHGGCCRSLNQTIGIGDVRVGFRKMCTEWPLES